MIMEVLGQPGAMDSFTLKEGGESHLMLISRLYFLITSSSGVLPVIIQYTPPEN
jgi:hypothetical protein